MLFLWENFALLCEHILDIYYIPMSLYLSFYALSNEPHATFLAPYFASLFCSCDLFPNWPALRNKWHWQMDQLYSWTTIWLIGRRNLEEITMLVSWCFPLCFRRMWLFILEQIDSDNMHKIQVGIDSLIWVCSWSKSRVFFSPATNKVIYEIYDKKVLRWNNMKTNNIIIHIVKNDLILVTPYSELHDLKTDMTWHRI